MRSGWPQSEDGQPTPANRGQVPFGPEVSWPNGFSQLDYQGGDYRYAAPQAPALPPGNHGAHPYAAFNSAGYGDDGYTDPGYQGPAAQDAGIAGTRTVRGFVEGQSQTGYSQGGYQQGGYAPSRDGYGPAGYAGSGYPEIGHIELAYPPAAPETSHADLYQQPWDYDQPLRYEGEDDAYPMPGGHSSGDGYGRDTYGGQQDDGAARYQQQGYNPAAYNGSDYSMPGINGPGYDLSGIIGTSDFEAVGYDEPSYGRLAYDDPRYAEPGRRFDETRFDVPRFDETRLDNLWLPSEDVRREASPSGYGNDGFSTQRPTRSEPSPAVDSGRNARNAQTRYDMRALVEPGDATRFDVPVFDETRLDNMRPLTPARGLRTSSAALLAPSGKQSRNWAEDTSLDHFADLDLTDEPVPAAFTRSAVAPLTDQPLELAPGQDDDTATRRAIGRRRGRSGDRRQWMALGAIAVVAAGAIGGVLMKYVFSGPSGPAHQVVVPASVDGYNQSANLVKQTDVASEAKQVEAKSSGQASDVVYSVYQMGSLTSASSSSTQIFMFVGGKLANADPSASVANFEQTYPGSVAVSPGSLGGTAACTVTKNNNQSVSMCVWFDNDTFGTVVSPTMTTAKLAATMDTVRPSLEISAQ